MWIFTREGFFSAVQSPEYCTDDELAVRGRSRQDLEALVRWLGARGPALEIIETPEADYRWRVILARSRWSDYVHQAAEAIDYPNFKGATTGGDRLRHDAYFGCWKSLWEWQHRQLAQTHR